MHYNKVIFQNNAQIMNKNNGKINGFQYFYEADTNGSTNLVKLSSKVKTLQLPNSNEQKIEQRHLYNKNIQYQMKSIAICPIQLIKQKNQASTTHVDTDNRQYIQTFLIISTEFQQKRYCNFDQIEQQIKQFVPQNITLTDQLIRVSYQKLALQAYLSKIYSHKRKGQTS